jgi:hypothetical protein
MHLRSDCTIQKLKANRNSKLKLKSSSQWIAHQYHYAGFHRTKQRNLIFSDSSVFARMRCVQCNRLCGRTLIRPYTCLSDCSLREIGAEKNIWSEERQMTSEWRKIYCHVYGWLIRRVWIRWLDLLITPCSITHNHNKSSAEDFFHDCLGLSKFCLDDDSLLNSQESESELLYDWRFPANQFVLAPSPLRLTARILFSQFNCCGHSPHMTSSLTRRWVCHLHLLLALASAFSGPSPVGLVTIFYCLSFETSLLSPPTTRRVTLEVFDPATTRETHSRPPLWSSGESSWLQM